MRRPSSATARPAKKTFSLSAFFNRYAAPALLVVAAGLAGDPAKAQSAPPAAQNTVGNNLEILTAEATILLQDQDADQRRTALQNLMNVAYADSARHRTIFDLVRPLTQDPDLEIRSLLASSLGYTFLIGGSPVSPDEIFDTLEALSQDGDENIRYKAAETILQEGPAYGAPFAARAFRVAERLQNDPAVINRELAIDLVAEGLEIDASFLANATTIVHKLSADDNDFIRSYAFDTLCLMAINIPQAAPAIMTILDHEASNTQQKSRYAAQRNLIEIGNERPQYQAQILALFKKRAMAKFKERATAKDVEIAMESHSYFGEMDKFAPAIQKDAIRFLRDLMNGPPRANDRAAFILGRSILNMAVSNNAHNDEIYATIKDLLLRDKADTSAIAADYIPFLAQIPRYRQESIDILFALSQKQSPRIIAATAKSLARVSSQQSGIENAVMPVLMQASQHDDRIVRWSSAEALGIIGKSYAAHAGAAKERLYAMLAEDKENDGVFLNSSTYALYEIALAHEEHAPEFSEYLKNMPAPLQDQISFVHKIEDIGIKWPGLRQSSMMIIHDSRMRKPYDYYDFRGIIRAIGQLAAQDDDSARAGLNLLKGYIGTQEPRLSKVALHAVKDLAKARDIVLTDAMKILTTASQDPIEDIRIIALNNLKDLQALQDQKDINREMRRRMQAEAALPAALRDENGARALLPVLHELVTGQDALNRQYGVESYGQVAHAHAALAPQALAAIAALHTDPQANVRMAVVKNIGMNIKKYPLLIQSVHPALGILREDLDPMIARLAQAVLALDPQQNKLAPPAP